MVANVDRACEQPSTVQWLTSRRRRDDCDAEGVPHFGIRDLILLDRVSDADSKGKSRGGNGVKGLSEGLEVLYVISQRPGSVPSFVISLMILMGSLPGGSKRRAG
jgi:hypothetical protein